MLTWMCVDARADTLHVDAWYLDVRLNALRAMRIKKEEKKLVVICALWDDNYLICALSVDAWTRRRVELVTDEMRKGGGGQRVWQELGLKKFCARLRSHNALLIKVVLLITRVTLGSSFKGFPRPSGQVSCYDKTYLKDFLPRRHVYPNPDMESYVL